jgi:hypothetical protein
MDSYSLAHHHWQTGAETEETSKKMLTKTSCGERNTVVVERERAERRD